MTKAFEVDKEGLAKIVARRGVEFAVLELIQNALDEDTSEILISLDRLPGSPYARLTVQDNNPNGFADLSHAYTLFAESAKKSDATKRGRFNLGEKLVIAICRKASIKTTTGSILFEGDKRTHSKVKTSAGSVFTGELRMTADDRQRTKEAVESIIVPHGVNVFFNGDMVETWSPRHEIKVSLPTEIADDEGYLRPTTRATTIKLYDRCGLETATLYEMGIPVVELEGDAFHIEICQKVPLNTDRDNVTPAYLRKVRSAVLNHIASTLDADSASQPWVTETMGSPEVDSEAVAGVIKARYGAKVVMADPSDYEGTQIAASRGYAVIQPGSFGKDAHRAIKAAGVALPAGKVTPSPKPFSEGGRQLKMLDPKKYQAAHTERIAFMKRIAYKLLGHTIEINIANDIGWPFGGCYSAGVHARLGGGEMTINQGRMGRKWFDLEHYDTRVLDIFIHELAHDYAGSHLDEKFHKSCTSLGAEMARLAIVEPELFKRSTWRH